MRTLLTKDWFRRIFASSPTPEMKKNTRLTTLDALRGIGSILVVLYHCGGVHPAFHLPSTYLAVDFFFALSGFVLTATYERPLKQDLSVFEFQVLRVVRLYPLFLAGLLLSAAVKAIAIITHRPGAMSISHWGISVVLESLMLPSPTDEHFFPLNDPAWSLFFEFLLGIVFSFALFKLRTGALLALSTVSFAALAVTAFSRGGLDVGWAWQNVGAAVPRVLFSFLAGMLIARIRAKYPRRPSWLTLPAIFGFAALTFVSPSPGQRPLFDLFYVLVLSPSLVWTGTTVDLPEPIRPIGEFLGDLSYAVYAIHLPLLSLGWVAMRAGVPNGIWIPAFIVLVLACAWCLTRWWDRPFRRDLMRRWSALSPHDNRAMVR